MFIKTNFYSSRYQKKYINDTFLVHFYSLRYRKIQIIYISKIYNTNLYNFFFFCINLINFVTVTVSLFPRWFAIKEKRRERNVNIVYKCNIYCVDITAYIYMYIYISIYNYIYMYIYIKISVYVFFFSFNKSWQTSFFNYFSNSENRGRQGEAGRQSLAGEEGAYPVEERKYSLFTQLRRQSGMRPTIARRISLAAISRNSVQLASL